MITLDALALPEDLIWVDEFMDSSVVHHFSFSLTGALIVQSGVKQAGRAITLTGDEQSAWITKAVLDDLYALQESNVQMLLTLNDGRTFDVIFNYQQKGLKAKPIVDFNSPIDADEYQVIIPLIRV